MRVAILTFHRAHNYGAVLQAYGLKKSCEEMGYDVDIIDYAPDYIEKQYQYFRITPSLKKNLLNLFNIQGNLSKKKKFVAFQQEYLGIVPIGEATKKSYDAILYGSDQIWNPKISGKFDEVYFGNHSIRTKKHISYAASIGKSSLEKIELKEIGYLLEKFDAISVREQTAKNILINVTEKEVEVVLDPTLLNDVNIWRKMEKQVMFLPSQYILVYEVSRFPETIRIAKELSKQTGLPIVEIIYCKTRFHEEHMQLNNIGPEEFLTLIEKATYVVTSSFHGTAFSIIFEKTFYTVLHHAYGNRMSDLLNAVGLENRIINGVIDKIETIDYTGVNKKLEIFKKKSKEFLKKNVEGN